MDLSILFKRAGKAAAENSPAILTAIGVTGTLATAYLAAKGAFKAAEVISEAQAEHDKEEKSHAFTTREKAELTWKLYIPAAISAGMAITAMIFSTRISDRRTAAMASAYSVVEKSYAEYRAKTLAKTSKKKEQDIRDEIAQDRVNKNPVSQSVLVPGGRGKTLCYDMWTDRWFNSDMELLRKAVNDFNAKVINETYASLSEFYYLIGIPPTSESDNIGWCTDQLLEVDFSGVINEYGEPAIAMDFTTKPIGRFASVY